MCSSDLADGGHTAFTDHRIQVPGKAPAVSESADVLRAWREPAAAFRGRGLGLAYAGAGMMERALPLLRGAGGDPEVLTALGLAAGALYAFNPATLYDSAYWGQVDSVVAAAMVGCLALLLARRPGTAAAVLEIGRAHV